jgi:hypothetical protein
VFPPRYQSLADADEICEGALTETRVQSSLLDLLSSTRGASQVGASKRKILARRAGMSRQAFRRRSTSERRGAASTKALVGGCELSALKRSWRGPAWSTAGEAKEVSARRLLDCSTRTSSASLEETRSPAMECPRFRGHLRAFVERRRPGCEKCLGPDRRIQRSFVGRRSSSFRFRARASGRSRRILGSPTSRCATGSNPDFRIRPIIWTSSLSGQFRRRRCLVGPPCGREFG